MTTEELVASASVLEASDVAGSAPHGEVDDYIKDCHAAGLPIDGAVWAAAYVQGALARRKEVP